MTGPYFRTIEDLQKYYYPEQEWDELLKADAPVVTGTTGARNILFGQKLWEQILVASTTFGVLPKKPWEKSGYRAITAAASTATLGVKQASAIPDTIKPTFAEISITPAVLAVSYDMSSTQDALADKDDTVRWAELMDYMADEFLNRINRNLHSDEDALKSLNNETIDRVCGATAEVTASKIDAGDEDIYGVDRSSNSWMDANVDLSADNEVLTLGMPDALIRDQSPYWSAFSATQNKVFITGFDTLERWQQLLQAQQRFADTTKAQISVNGIQTYNGAEGGFMISTYRGIPIFPDSNTLQDTISRIYLLDTDTVHWGVLKPAQHLESDNYQLLGKFAREGVDYMEGEVVCTSFKSQGKRRDIK